VRPLPGRDARDEGPAGDLRRRRPLPARRHVVRRGPRGPRGVMPARTGWGGRKGLRAI
jgi:hypothetical protein